MNVPQQDMRSNHAVTILAILSTCLAGCVMPPGPPPPAAVAAGATGKSVPRDRKFWWGTATATYQNEDRGVPKDSPKYFLTDWDVFGFEGRAPVRGEDATFSWTHFDKDVAALKQMNVTHYRFGVEWARIEPQPGVINHEALDRYVQMARKLRRAGIEPVVTLWHFTFPSWLYDKNNKARSNFLHPDMLPAWRAHVERVVGALKNDVRIFVPQNEPNGALQLGYIAGHWPPGLLLRPFAYKEAMRNGVTMFRDAADIIKRERPDSIVIGIYSLPHWRKNRLQDPTYLVYNIVQRQNWDHLDQVADKIDIIGVNYYYSQDASLTRFLHRDHGEKSADFTQLGWEIQPEGMYHTLKAVHDRYNRPVIISENGLGTASEQKKIRYLREHIAQVRRAIADGVDVRGYFPWTLVDNYEWTEGWTANFGLTSLDPETKERRIEPAGRWFSKYILTHPHL